MKVSVIITVLDEEKYIRKCLLSLKEQTFKDFEIIVINDGSTDKTLKIINNLAIKQFDNLTILSQKHQGTAISRNLGAQKAKGKILVFVDADMYFDKDFLKDLILPIKLGKAKGTFSTKEYVANWNNIWARCWNYNWNLPDQRKIDPKRKDQQRDFRAIFKKEFLKVGGFDDVGYTDVWTLSEKLGYNPQPTKALYYHYNPNSLKEVFNQARWVAKREYKFGRLGETVALIRVSFLFSFINGFGKSIIKKEPRFIIFKLIYDLAIFIGLIEKRLK